MTTASPAPATAPADRAEAAPDDAALLSDIERAPGWMHLVMLAAAAYNIAWGAWVILFPNAWFTMAGMEPPLYPHVWQCVGMIVGVYGIGYAIAAVDPVRWWAIVLVGLLGKVFGPIGFVGAVIEGALPLAAGWTILTNDLIWWVPFGLILLEARRRCRRQRDAVQAVSEQHVAQALRHATTSAGDTLEALSHRQPILLVCLRHFGCTFCRETLADLAKHRATIEASGLRIALAHMGAPDQAEAFFARYGLSDLPHVSDPEQRLYRGLGLSRDGGWDLFNPRVWGRGFTAGVVAGHGVGPLVGDGLQMPGAFVIHHGRLVRAYRHRSAADRPDYCELAQVDGIGSPAPSSPVA